MPKLWAVIGGAMMSRQAEMDPEQSLFAVFCIEALADDLMTTGDQVYRMLTEDSDLLDDYIIPCYGALHTQGKEWLVDDLKRLLLERGLLQ
jgi:hypothetical protein